MQWSDTLARMQHIGGIELMQRQPWAGLNLLILQAFTTGCPTSVQRRVSRRSSVPSPLHKSLELFRFLRRDEPAVPARKKNYVDTRPFDVNLTNMKLKASKQDRRAYSQTTRAAAAAETGQRIVDAFIDRLLVQWFDEITLDQVAADAGVTVQTVIRRFGGKEGLLDEGARAMGARINAKRGQSVGNIVEYVDSLYADYEQTGDAVMRLLALELRHPSVMLVTNHGRREHRLWVTACMENFLKHFAEPDRQSVVDTLVITSDVYTWKLLRRDMKRSIPEAKSITVKMIEAILSGPLSR